MAKTEWAMNEAKGAEVPDERQRESIAAILERIAENPETAFSRAVGPNKRQAADRLFIHADITPAGLLAGHIDQTIKRCLEQGPDRLILIAQDTTALNYTSHPATTGLGPIGKATTRGLFVHTAVALTEEGEPLGILYQAIWARDPDAFGQSHDRRSRPAEEKESAKWAECMRAVERILPEDLKRVYITDREGDVFDYLAAPRGANADLLVRAVQARTVEVIDQGSPGRCLLPDALEKAPVVGTRRVTVPAQPGREERVAVLELRVTPVEVQPPRHRSAGDSAKPVRLTAIRAKEIAPPEGVEPLEGVLLTTLEARDAEAVNRIVGYYEQRWKCERFHYVLKSGVGVEKLQFRTAAKLSRAITLLSIVAWRLLWLTYRARVDPDGPAEGVFTPIEVTVLREATQQTVTTLREAVRAMARLGGWYGSPSVGEPGVKSLWLGLRRLAVMVEGYQLALAHLNPLLYNYILDLDYSSNCVT
jgi:hypothetical protein